VEAAPVNAHDKTPRPYDRDQARWSRLRAALRGIATVLRLFVTAVDALVTAALGKGPLVPLAHRLGHVIAGEYRAGRAGAIDVDADREAR
jgi:hypothetical protein